MIKTSTEYKKAVYGKVPYETVARHFLPVALLKIIDTDARNTVEYEASTKEFYSNFAELIDDIMDSKNCFGTLEPDQFLLSAPGVVLMPAPGESFAGAQRGWVTEIMSDNDGNIDATLTCEYTTPVSTVGRVLYFNACYDAVPSAFSLTYYRKGVEVASDSFVDNQDYVVTSQVPVSNYDKLVFHFTKTSRPRRRIQLIEDIPGVYLNYAGNDVVSLTLSQSVDIFSEELVVGEMEVAVQNVTKALDILNTNGVEAYLQRRQPFEVKLRLVFPDDSSEDVLLGYWDLTAWKSNKGALEATFTINDPLSRLTQEKYIKGVLPDHGKSFYDLAVSVFEDAGFKDYIIDQELLNIYTRASLPIATHKELLRIIAQATQSVVVPTADGKIHIKYISPLVYGNNCVKNSAFETDKDWTLTNAALSTDYIYAGSASVKLGANAVVTQTMEIPAGHKLYLRAYALPLKDLKPLAGSAYMDFNGAHCSVDLKYANLNTDVWTDLSGVAVSGETNTITFTSSFEADILFLDGVMVLDLTQTYGAGMEPTQEWCDTNIRFFEKTLMIPRAHDPAPLDTLDYSILLDAPEVELSSPVKSVETSIYGYEADAEASEIYKSARVISGTETFDIQFNSLAKECTVKLQVLAEDGTAKDITAESLLSSTIYSQAATLKVRANDMVQIIVTGKRVTTNTSTYKVTAELDPKLIDDAEAKVIDNPLITYKTVAEDVTSFAAYWYGRRYQYDFDWRQNPAVEILDTVTVMDDFRNNKGVMLTERNIEYTNGVLTGSAKGVTG